MHNRVTTTTLKHGRYTYQFRIWMTGGRSKGLLVKLTHDGHVFVRGPSGWVNWS